MKALLGQSIIATRTETTAQGSVWWGGGGERFHLVIGKSGVLILLITATDGLSLLQTNHQAVHYGYTDSNSNPITLRTAMIHKGTQRYHDAGKKGDYWRIYQPSPIGTSNNVYWLPILVAVEVILLHFLVNKTGLIN